MDAKPGARKLRPAAYALGSLLGLAAIRCGDAARAPAHDGADAADAGTHADREADTSSHDATPRVECASRASSPPSCSTGSCTEDEDCFTQVSCGPLASGERICTAETDLGDAGGDDSCHKRCESVSECAPGERCARYLFFGCKDFNGYPQGRGICCGGGASECL